MPQLVINVPNVPGVPALASYAQDAVDQLLSSGLSSYGYGLQPQWGIYYNGSPVVVSDNVVAFDFRVERALSNYPIERGGFETYDKVAVPYLAKVQFSAGGDEANRADLLRSVAAAADLVVGGKPAKFDVITPEIVYLSCSISHYDYRRTAQSGLGLIIIDVWVQEVREQNSGSGSSSAEPSGATQTDGGDVQAQTPSSVDGVTADEAQRGVLTGETSSPAAASTFNSELGNGFQVDSTGQDLTNNALGFTFTGEVVQ